MERLDKSIPKLEKGLNRVAHNSIYQNLQNPDYYDSIKILKTQIKVQTKKTDAFVDLKKQQKRDLTTMLQSTESYKNVLRDNKRADYVERLLTGT